MRSFKRSVINALKAQHPGIEIVVLRQRVHMVLELKLGSRCAHLPISVSPKNQDHALLNAVRDAAKLLA